jgi:hypothetical protein
VGLASALVYYISYLGSMLIDHLCSPFPLLLSALDFPMSAKLVHPQPVFDLLQFTSCWVLDTISGVASFTWEASFSFKEGVIS